MSAPVKYVPGFVSDPARAFAELLTLDWERRPDAPRCEYYCNDLNLPYMYGRGKGRRLYEPRPYNPTILAIRAALEAMTGSKFEVCFLNRYLNQSDHLGWHADDSPEMDDARPIGVVSLGVEREIWFRKKPESLVANEDRREGPLNFLQLLKASSSDGESWTVMSPRMSLFITAPHGSRVGLIVECR